MSIDTCQLFLRHLTQNYYMKSIEDLTLEFSARLKDLMKDKNINSVELAKQVGIPRASIANWLICRRSPQIDALYKLADFFGVSTDFLLGRQDF